MPSFEERSRTCNYCVKTFPTVDGFKLHWNHCPVRIEHGYINGSALQHVPLQPVRNMLPEIVFSTEWKALMESTPEYVDDDFVSVFHDMFNHIPGRKKQRHAHLAATFVTWLGTNCGASFLHAARHMKEACPASYRTSNYLAVWSIENFRHSYVNRGWRLIEFFLTPDWEPTPQTAPTVTRTDAEIIETIAYWLGGTEGQKFLARCEAKIKLREKGLSDSDIKAVEGYIKSMN